MKKINYYLGALALATLGLTSCSSNELTPDDEYINRTDIERQVYVNIAIHGEHSGGSRADYEYAPGADESKESEINNVYLVFYDENGNVVGDVVLADPDWNKQTAGQSVETVGTETLQITLAVGQQQPSYVMCYINPVNQAELKNPLSTLQTLTRDAVVNLDGTFPMSNSVYYDEYNNLITATPVAGQFYATMELAEQAAAAGESVDIYVERYAAKLVMTEVNPDMVTPYTTATMTDAAPGTGEQIPVVLTFVPNAWDINGVAENTYAIKSFREPSTTGQILPNDFEYDRLNSLINAVSFSFNDGLPSVEGLLTDGNAWAWNSSDLHRSYWSCSPVYFQANYPEVGADYNPDEMNQIFLSYNDIANSNRSWGKPEYFMETTSGIPALRSKNPNAAVPSVLLTGDYTLTVGGTTLPVGTTFYTYVPLSITGIEGTRPSVYFDVAQTNEADDQTAASAINIANTMSMQKRFLWQTTVLYKLVDGHYVRFDVTDATDLNRLVRATEVTRPANKVLVLASADDADSVKMADRTKTLQLKSNATLDGLYINDNGVPKQIVSNNATVNAATQVTLDRANLILWQNVGTCNRYEQGAAFFNIPVKHLGWYRGGNEQMAETSDIDFAKVRVGDLGMVRNHSYTITVNKITGLAAGVGGKDLPIVPPADTQDVYVSYRVNVLQWAVVPEQGVDL